MATCNRIKIAYPAVLTPEEEGGFSVHFPDLEGCVTEGETREEALVNAREALTGYLTARFSRGFSVEDGKEPRDLESGQTWEWVEPENRVAIPLALRKARLVAGLSQQVVAHRMGIAYTTYQRFENVRKWNMTYTSLEKACRVLDCELDVEIGRFG